MEAIKFGNRKNLLYLVLPFLLSFQYNKACLQFANGNNFIFNAFYQRLYICSLHKLPSCYKGNA